MPTSSLCAEHTVTKTALANDPGLKREYLLMAAVLSVQFPEFSLPPGPPICQSVMSSSSADFAFKVKDKLKQHQTHGGMCRTASAFNFTSIAKDGPPESSKPEEHKEWEMYSFQHILLSLLASSVA